MPHFSLIAVSAATLFFATSSDASTLTIGSGFAKSCFLAAEAQDTRRLSFDSCDSALSEEALSLEDRAATLVNRGILHLRRVNLKQADADFDAALALDPNHPEAWLNKAILIVRHGNGAAALPMVEKALEFNTRRPALAYFVRAIAYEDSGNIVAAYRDLQRARDLDPRWQEPVIELRRFQVRQL